MVAVGLGSAQARPVAAPVDTRGDALQLVADDRGPGFWTSTLCRVLRRMGSHPGFCLAAVLAPIAGAPAAANDLVQEMGAAAFLDTIGVNTHMTVPVTGPTGASYGNVDLVIRELRMIGVKHIRESMLIGDNLWEIAKINKELGIKVVYDYDYYGKDGGTAVLRRALANVKTQADLIDGLEGPNEPDQFGLHFNGLTGAPAVRQAQSELYAAVKDDPALSQIPVYCPSLSFPAPGGLASKMTDISAFCDYATSHDYVENWSLGPFLPLAYLQTWTKFANAFVPGRKHIITEGGWTTNPGNDEGVDEATQAKYTLVYLLDAAAVGVVRTYLYDLIDDGNDPGFTDNVNHYGLFRYDGSPKPVATMLSNVNQLLGGDSGGGSGGALAFEVTGLPETGRQMLLRESDDTFVIALWNETSLWDRKLHKPRQVADIPVVVEFERAPATVDRADPVFDATPRRQRVADRKLSLSLPDHPIFLVVKAETGGR